MAKNAYEWRHDMKNGAFTHLKSKLKIKLNNDYMSFEFPRNDESK